jgi:hypothetical protein
MQNQVLNLYSNAQANSATYANGAQFVLEGVLIKGLTYSDPDQTKSDYVTIGLTLSVDRVYPYDINNLAKVPVIAVSTPSTVTA